MNRLYLLLLIITAFSCTQNHSNFSEKITLENSLWISDSKPLPSTDSLFYLDDHSPLFRKEFVMEDKIKSAKLLITAAGYYNAFINGKRIGNEELSPTWTDYSKRIYYSEYDISDEIRKGNNCLGVTLGNGFYNLLPLRMWGRRNLRDVLPVGRPMFIAKLIITYKNGKTKEFITDDSWKFAYGPVTKNSIYLGVVYDSRKEIEDWHSLNFDDATWKNATIKNGPGGELQKAFFPSIQVTEKIKPINITTPENGTYVVDMGVNFTGTYKIKLTGEKDDTVNFRFGERIYEDGTLNPMTTVCGQIKKKGAGGPGAPDIAWQTDSYIFKDDAEVWYQPEFTFHTYRYMEISGARNKPQISDIEGLMIHSDVKRENEFQCSSELLNSIQEATEQTFLSNLVGVQSDCAAREKFGYGGDLNATSESFIYNFDMQQFYRKTIYDWLDAVNDSGFVDTAPFVGIQYCGISWESAVLTTQYYLYLYYNDTDIIKELYEFDKKWMEKVARIHPNKIVASGLSDHESMEPVPVELTGTCHYLQCAKIMAEFAKVMNDDEANQKYNELAEELKELIKERFWDTPIKEEINKQTLYSALFYHDILPKDGIKALSDSLLMALKNGPSGHLNTGIFGTKYMLEALSESGNSKSVFNVVNSTAYPGWGFMIDKGATTIWETWKESDNTYSNCHPMFGTVTEWFYRWLGGIKPNSEYPGFQQFVLSPFIPDDLEYVNCKYQSPFGEIISNWKKTNVGMIVFEIKIPKESSAKFQLYSNELTNIAIKNVETGKSIKTTDGVFKEEGIMFNAGHYTISGIMAVE